MRGKREMAKKNEARVTFKASTEQFSAAIDESRSVIGRMNAELKKNAAELKASGSDAQLLGQRVDLLSQKHEEQANVVENMRHRLEAAKAAYGENSAEVRKMETQIASAEATLQGYANQLDQAKARLASSESAYGQLTAAISRQETELGQLEREYASAVIAKGKDSAEARQLEGRIGSLSSELRQNRDRLESAEQAARELAGGFDRVEGAAKDAAGSIADIAAGNMIADFAQGAISSLAELDEATQENRVNMTQLKLAYESSNRTAEDATETYRKFLGILGDGDQATEAALDMRNLADAGADVSEWCTIAAGAATAFGDALPVENLIESANETVRCGQITGGLADAINWTTISQEQLNQRMTEYPAVMEAYNKAVGEGLSQEDAMNAALAECGDAQERTALLTAALGIQYSELGGQFEEANQTVSDARLATDDLTQAQSKLADEVAPLKTAVTELAADGIDFLAENLEWVVPVAAGAGTAFAILAVAMNFASIVQGVSTAFGVLNAVMAMNPIVLVIAALAGLVLAFKLLWDNCEEFRDFWKGAWDEVCSDAEQAKAFFSEVAQGFISTLNSIRAGASSAWNGFTSSITGALSGARQSVFGFKDSVVGKFNEIRNGIADKINGASNAVSSAISRIKGFFNFSWSLPHLKMPHPYVSGRFSLNPPSVPSFGISWYAKAMDSAMVLSRPTIFGMAGGNLLGGGEAGNEVVAGEGHLMRLIGTTVQRVLEPGGTDRIVAAVEKLAERVTVLEVDGREIASATADADDRVSGGRQELAERGLAL